MKYTISHMQNKNRQNKLSTFFELLRWNKPTGRMILLIPAGWSLYLTPDANPTFLMLLRIILGGLLVSGLGCVVNDCLLYTSPSPRDDVISRMPSSA